MNTLKQEVIRAFSILPETADIDDMMYQLYVMEKIRKGNEDVLNNQVYSTNSLREEIKLW